ncbi:TatD family hydrolase [Mesoplasma photuris]|uniref:TatD family hydrolase n=1 Tax=Mesoplasma photuris TaxID=217731 RepID=UPI0004E116B8|nr:TatD family hydrolase [Mesoplasma photuris]
MIDKNKIFDAHIHLNDQEDMYATMDISEIIENGRNNGVGGWLCASYHLKSSKIAIELAEKYDDIYAAIAIHPNDVQNSSKEELLELRKMAPHPKVLAIGETGLDYFYSKKFINLQKEFLREHISIAEENDIAVQLHIRDAKDVYEAYDDAIEILKDTKPKTIIIHCFSANLEYAKKFVELGAYINIGGAVTFKNAIDLQEAASWIPLDNLLLETDAPWLAPHPHRGKVNLPEMINQTAEKIAELKNISKEEIILATTENAIKALKIKD